MGVLQTIDALVEGVSRDEIEKMSPVHRRRLAQALRHVADLCDPPALRDSPRSGVLGRLCAGERAEESDPE
jgi:hypothetical protein